MNQEIGNTYFFPSRISLRQNILWIASIALIYFAMARLSLSLVFEPEGIAAIWPPAGIFLSSILLSRRNLRPYLVGVLFIIDFIAEMLTGTPLPVSLIYAFVLTADAVLSSWLLIQFVGEPIDFSKIKDVIGFLLLSVILSNVLWSFLSAVASTHFLETPFLKSFQWWSTSDGIGNLLVTPLILSWASLAKTGLKTWNQKRVLEGAALFIPLVLMNHLVFRYLSAHTQFSLLLTYATFPYLLWAAMRFSVRGVTIALLLVATIAIYSTASGNVINVVLHDSPLDAVIVVQLYLAIMAIPSLLLSAVVAESKRAGKELRESETRYRAIIESSPDAITQSDLNGKILMCNAQTALLHGYERPEELIGTSVFDLFLPEELERARVNLQKTLKDSVIRNAEYRLLKKDGSQFQIELSATVIRDAEGNPVSFMALTRDITERKRAEEVIGKALQEWQTTFDATNDAMWILDKDQRVLRSNKTSEHIFQRANGELIGKHCWEIVHCTTQPIPECPFLRARNSLRRESMELQIGKNWFEVIVDPILDATGRFDGAVHIVSDITDRKRAEDALSKSEERMRAIVEGTPHLFFYTQDTEAKTIYVSPTVEQITGYKVDVWIKRQDWFTTDTKFNQVAKEITRAHLRGEFTKEPVYIEVRHATGREILLEAYEYPIIKNGKVIGLQGVVHDITERKRTENALFESEEKFRKVFEEGPLGMAMDSLTDGRLIDVNRSLCEMLGYTKEELMHITFKDATYPDDLSVDVEAVKGLQEGQIQRHQTEKRYLKKNGEVIWATRTLSKISSTDRKSFYVLVMIEDITERKEAEEALKESEEKYRAMVEQINDVIYTTDTNGIFTYISPTVEILGGYKPEEMIGHSLGEFLDPQFLPKNKEQFQNVMAGNLVPTEYLVKIKSGEFRWIRTSSRPIIKENKPIGIRGVLTDITERKQAEEAVRQMQKLEGLGTLAGGIAHDFNNILGIILAYNANIKRYKNDTKQLDLATETITKAVQRGQTLVQSILTFARKTETAFGPVNVNDVVMEIMTMILETFPKNLTYSQNFDKAVPYINADRSQLHQVLMNLCVNARDAMPNGGVLTINTRMISVEKLRNQHPDAAASGYVCIEVSDTGEGMSEEIRKRIFEPFFTTKEIGKGTGLGLSVTFGVIQSHSGFIDVDSDPGKGTTFRIYLPASHMVAPITEKEEEMLESIPGGTETLLIAEDEEMLRMPLQMVLIEKGYKVLSVKDGFEAVNTYKERMKEIALVLTDLGLPRMTGMEECVQIKKINPNARMIVATGFLDPEMKSEFLKAGIQHFLLKPYDIKKVLKMVREVLDEK